jgi:hypothetical protein
MRRQAIVVQDEMRNGLLPHIVNWLYLRLNVMIINMCDPTEFYLIYKQANEGEERDIVIFEILGGLYIDRRVCCIQKAYQNPILT